jgi:hypothetical protein
VFQDPFEQMFSFEYVISGSWSNPRVERTGHQATTVLGPTAPVEPSPQ